VSRHYADYLPEGSTGDLADQIANTAFDDPEPRIWIVPVDPDEPGEPGGPWNASCEFGEDVEEFHGSREEAIVWARRTPATERYIRVGGNDVLLSPEPGDAPPPPPVGPTVQVHGPDAAGRWVAIWFHRGEVKQFWGSRPDVTAWARTQPAERRRICVDGAAWRRLEP
jgi:hypothetical protein